MESVANISHIFLINVLELYNIFTQLLLLIRVIFCKISQKKYLK